MKRLLIALALTALCGQVEAREYRGHHRLSVTSFPSHWLLDKGPRIVHLPPMTEAQQVEDRKWEAFCQPVRNADEWGVVRLSYAHKGCEFGRSQ